MGCRRGGSETMTHDSTEMAARLRARLAAAPLWPFALDLYARPGVEAACLRLQDEAGVDVCELLWRCWLLHHGAVPDVALEASLAEIRGWQREVTAPLRRLRRGLKARAARREGVAALRETLKRAELQAERETLSRLQDLTLCGQSGPLSAPHPDYEKVLAETLKLQKKPHLSTLNSLVACLDPPRGPR